MRQHMLNGWLVAALVALVCLLGITTYVEVKTDIPQAACGYGNRGIGRQAAGCEICSPAPCDSTVPRA
ncbi:hypothetical protein EH240_25240 [Mesorhizobium tamadayense]|uniref:Uncharacterized protein n=1 Tax=Mesorhizobium tamadayense TaxID=425306 RepID=A0A3P3FA79_9HYPH|nr:hypothetical protein [Mesorhizobium tamadayense]RRH95307.1 hypothetical protein EH240_25240 [Mesorhizobium tamadayense]